MPNLLGKLEDWIAANMLEISNVSNLLLESIRVFFLIWLAKKNIVWK